MDSKKIVNTFAIIHDNSGFNEGAKSKLIFLSTKCSIFDFLALNLTA